MIVLGIETAAPVCGVGLADESGLVSEFRVKRGMNHAESLALQAEAVCRSAKLSFDALDGVAVSIGPGSFTGLRIGLGYAKGLAFGANLALIAVPTLDAMIGQIPPVCTRACVLLKARKGEAYRGLFKWQENKWISTHPYDVVTESNVLSKIPDGEILCMGNAVHFFQQTLEADDRVVLMQSGLNGSSGYSVAAIGLQKLIAGDTAEPDELTPRYLKRFGAS